MGEKECNFRVRGTSNVPGHKTSAGEGILRLKMNQAHQAKHRIGAYNFI